MANQFDTLEMTDLRRFAGYSERVGEEALTGNAALLDARLAELNAEQAELVRSKFLRSLRLQEVALRDSYLNMSNESIGKGAIVRNPDELSNRQELMRALGRSLAAFLRVPAGPSLSSANRVRVVPLVR